MDELHLMLRVGVCCSETSSYMPTAGTMLAESIEEKMPTASGSWNEPFGPVRSVSRYGRNGSQLENQSLAALIGQRKTSYKFEDAARKDECVTAPDSISPRVTALWRVSVGK